MKTFLLSFAALFFMGVAAQELPDFAMPKGKVDASLVPASYAFSWKYTLEIKSDKAKTMTADYLLQPGGEYFGMKMGEMLMIMDTKNKLTVTTFGKGGQKTAMASKMPDYSKMADKQNLSQFTYKSLPEKTFLGYKCKGVQATNAEYSMVFYYTNDAPVNFADMFKSPQAQQMPDAFKNYFKPGDKPLILSADITDLKKKTTTAIKCVALEKNAFTFKKSDYKIL